MFHFGKQLDGCLWCDYDFIVAVQLNCKCCFEGWSCSWSSRRPEVWRTWKQLYRKRYSFWTTFNLLLQFSVASYWHSRRRWRKLMLLVIIAALFLKVNTEMEMQWVIWSPNERGRLKLITKTTRSAWSCAALKPDCVGCNFKMCQNEKLTCSWFELIITSRLTLRLRFQTEMSI